MIWTKLLHFVASVSTASAASPTPSETTQSTCPSSQAKLSTDPIFFHLLYAGSARPRRQLRARALQVEQSHARAEGGSRRQLQDRHGRQCVSCACQLHDLTVNCACQLYDLTVSCACQLLDLTVSCACQLHDLTVSCACQLHDLTVSCA